MRNGKWSHRQQGDGEGYVRAAEEVRRTGGREIRSKITNRRRMGGEGGLGSVVALRETLAVAWSNEKRLWHGAGYGGS